jgi:hypothetical protein
LALQDVFLWSPLVPGVDNLELRPFQEGEVRSRWAFDMLLYTPRAAQRCLYDPVGQVLMQKRAGGNFKRWERWAAFSVSGDARTNWTDPGTGEML